MSDLWPTDLDAVATAKSPITILKAQASILGSKTKNIVKAYVRRFPPDHPALSRQWRAAKSKRQEAEPFNYGFYLQAPALDNYTYHLFTLSFGVEAYPAHFLVDDDIAKEMSVDQTEGIVVNDEKQFERVLSEVLASQKTRKVISAIWTQSVDLGANTEDASERPNVSVAHGCARGESTHFRSACDSSTASATSWALSPS